jgi:hypothetical protein
MERSNKLKDSIHSLVAAANRPHLGIALLLLTVALTGLILALLRHPANDEVFYLKDALQMADNIKDGQWFGNENVGFHGFLFKIPAALLILLTGPSVFAATLTTTILAVLAIYLSYLIFQHVLASEKWSLMGSILVFTTIFFMRALGTFLRDIAIVFALMLLIYMALKKMNRWFGGQWLLGLSLLLVLDAKESVFFMILPGFIFWLFYDLYLRHKSESLMRIITKGFAHVMIVLLPSLLFTFLMFTSSIIPLNSVMSKIIGLNKGHLSNFISENFGVGNAVRNPEEGGKETPQLAQISNYGWTATESGEVISEPHFLTKDEFPVVKLVKPKGTSTHKSGGHFHITRNLLKPEFYPKGSVLYYSFWYKVPGPRAIYMWAINHYPAKAWPQVRRKIRLKKDNKWHYVSISIKVERSGKIRPLLVWPHERDMIVLLAGCKVTVKSPNIKSLMQSLTFNVKRAGMGKSPKKRIKKPMKPSGQPQVKKLPGGWLWWLKQKSVYVINLLMAYIGKLFYPRTFSFTATPRFIILPALLMSFLLFQRWRQEKEYEKLMLTFVFWSYMFVYWIRASLGRYMLPIVPIVILFFIFFLLEGLKKPRFARNTLIATVIFSFIGFFFESKYPMIKLCLMVFFLTGFWLLYILQQKNARQLSLYKLGYAAMIALLSGMVFLGSSFANARQLGRYHVFGYCGQMEKISSLFKDKERIWINHDVGLIQFFRHDGRYSYFKEGVQNWQLEEWVPKAALMKQSDYYSYSFAWKDAVELEQQIAENKIQTVAMVVSTFKKKIYDFPMQEQLTLLKTVPFLTLKKIIKLKNKHAYLFHVK